MERRTAVALSTTAHAGILVWAAIAGFFDAPNDEENVQVAEVSVLTSTEFDALLSNAPPSVEPPAPDAPTPPEAEPGETALPEPDTRPQVAQPDAPTPAPPEREPDVAALAPPPRTEVAPDVPEAPSAPAETPDAPVSDRPAPRAAPRVAPVPAPAPPPATETAPVVQAPPAPAEAEDPTPPAETEAAPEEAAPVIVTEADTPSAAPDRSVRPTRRPTRPAPTVAEAETPEAPAPPEPTEEATAPTPPEEPREIDTSAALAAALGGDGAAEPAASGPPLTPGERDGLRVAVQGCWVVDPGAPSARAIVTVGVEMDREGNPRTDTIRLVSSEGEGGAASERAFEAARRAIIRCARGGYDLPAEKYEQWRQIEMTFDPTTMRLR
ncbi:MAG: hypothetical protein AAF264_04440 [Pseudomonadota bacterium]